ncbi:MAG: YfhO family protein [Chloroflexota bacterium]
MRRFFGRRDALAALFLAILTILIYFPLTIQGRVLSSFDSLVYFYPNAVYLAERVRAGQLPLWDPYLFAGVPFLANSQVGALYPPNLLYLLGPVSRGYARLVVLHVWWLAFGTYLLGRASLGTSRLAALFAAIAVAFGGFVGGMNGHLNQLEALAWAPLAILLVERGAVARSWRIQVLAAIPFALSALAGHSQELYMTGVMAALAGFSRVVQGWAGRAPFGWPPLERPGSPAPPKKLAIPQRLDPATIAADLVRLAVGPALGVTIAAAQLVPTLELTRLSIRSAGLDFADAASFSLPPPLVLTTLLPSIGQSPPSTEWLGYVGLVTVVLAVVGLCRRPSPEAWWLAGLAAVGLALALGKYTPIFHLAFEVVPGVRLFRVPARWLTLWTLGIGLLAAWGFDSVVGCGVRATARRSIGPTSGLSELTRSLAIVGGLIALGVIGIETYTHRQLMTWPARATLELWGGSLAALLAIWWIARSSRRAAAWGLLALVASELVIASLSLPYQDAIWLDGVETHRVSVDYLLAQHTSDRVMAIGENSFDPGDLADLRRLLSGTLSSDAIAEYVTAVKHVEGLTPNLSLRFGIRTIDGYDGGLLPLNHFAALKQLFPVQGTVVADGRLRLQLKSVPDPRLLGWLDVRYVLINRLRDQWVDGVYYDLSVTQPAGPGAPLVLPATAPFPTTAIGVIFRGEDGAAPVGTLRLDAGSQTAFLAVGTGSRAGKHLDSDVDPDGVWLWTINLPRPADVSSVIATWQGQSPIALRSLSLIDRRTGLSQALSVSPDYRLAFLGDVKVYENRDVLPRAFLADGLDVVANPGAVTTELERGGWDPRAYAVASASEVPVSQAFRTSGDPGAATIAEDEPERVVVQTSAAGPRILVLTDSFYPGWQVTVDGVREPILPVNSLFRGVVLSPGMHRVAFSYQPASWRIGIIVSVIGLVVTAGALALIRR